MLQTFVSTFTTWWENHSSGDKNQNRSIMSGKEIMPSKKEVESYRKTLIKFELPKIIVMQYTKETLTILMI